MNIYLYNNNNTVIHRLDPRTKLFILVTTFVASVLHAHPFYIVPVTCLVLLHCLLARCWVNVRKLGFLMGVISLFSLLLWTVYAKGPTHLIWRIKLEPVLYGLGVALKLDTMLIAGMIFLSSTKNEDITQGLIKLNIPYSFSFAFSTALRLLPTLIGTSQSIAQAQRSRGLDLNTGNLFARAKKHIPLLVPIFLTSIRTTDQLAMALDSKGFKCKQIRTFYNNIQFRAIDWLCVAALTGFLLINVYLKWLGFGFIPGLVLSP